MMRDFFKFPSTLHLAALRNNDVRDDKCFSDVERELFLSHEITIEEKIDGANLGISFDSNGDTFFQNRGSAVTEFSGQWKKLRNWYLQHSDFLFDSLSDRYILFGEWCYAKHSVFYDSLPDLFVAFDVFDKKAERFFSVRRRNAFLNESGIFSVPFIAEGRFSFEQLKNMTFTSHFGHENAEGIYCRIDEGDWLRQRAKLVRPAFRQTIKEHWSHQAICLNQIKMVYA